MCIIWKRELLKTAVPQRPNKFLMLDGSDTGIFHVVCLLVGEQLGQA